MSDIEIAYLGNIYDLIFILICLSKKSSMFNILEISLIAIGSENVQFRADISTSVSSQTDGLQSCTVELFISCDCGFEGCVYIYIYIYIYMHTYTYVYIYIYIYLHAYIYIYIYIYMRVYLFFDLIWFDLTWLDLSTYSIHIFFYTMSIYIYYIYI